MYTTKQKSRFFLICIITWLHCHRLLLTSTICEGYTIKEDESFLQHPRYQSQEEMEDLFARLEKEFPEHARVETIGRSVEGRNLIVLLISRNVRQRNILTPPVKYIGNMHGDETVGRQLLVYLAQYLLFNYVRNTEVAQLVNTTDIYIMPTMNPDGFTYSQEGNCESLPNYVGRGNAAGVDLNRDFPDRLEGAEVTQIRSQSRQPETAAITTWILSKPFVLSANFHGGAVVASYPYDNSIAHHECCEESLTPDDRIFKLMAHTYADNHPIMRRGNNCNDSFAGGITNGANWYELSGGMQDFNYAFSNCFELTIELSCCKYPQASTLPDEWARNKRSLIELLKLAHIGIKGLVKDVNGYPIADATIVVSGLEEKPISTTKRGEYWRLLIPGIYNVYAVAFGYQSSAPQQIHVTNDNSEAQRLDFTLSPIETNYDGDFRKVKVIRSEPSMDPDAFLTPTEFVHHNYTSMEKYLRGIAEAYPSITRLYSIGKSVQGRDLWVMEISVMPGQHVPGIPEFKYVANMHGNEVVGKEMLLLLTKYICERYLSDKRITKLVNTTRMHFLYSMNPDGYEISHEGDKSSGLGRHNAHDVDLNRNFPDQYGTDQLNKVTEPEVAAVMNWTLSLPFVLSANLHGGSLVANYPYDDNENDFNDPYARLRKPDIKGRKLNPTVDDALFKHLALIYSEAHPTMHLGSPCPLFQYETFPKGITNGAEWYSVTGGMQDWNYVRGGVMELTIEMGCDKFPMAEELPQLWRDHREPLLRFIEQVQHSIHGFVKSSIGMPIGGAMIKLDGTNHTTYSTSYGDYWRLVLPGRHNVTVQSDGYAPQREEVEVPSVEPRAMRLDVTLMRDDPQHWASANDYRIIENVVNTRYHIDGELRARMAELENQNGQIATFGYGDNEFSRYYNYIKLTSDIGEPEENKFKILVLSSLFDTTAPLAREITMNLIRHIIEGYRIREPSMMKLLQRSVIYFVPLTERFDAVFDMFNKNTSICDPVLPNELADSILSPESEKARDKLLSFLSNEKFDLMLSFGAGNSDISYPKGEQILEKLARRIEATEFNYSPLQCAASATRSLHRETTVRLENLFYKYYNIPMFTVGLSCCRMPEQSQIAVIWRKNLDKLKNFFNLIETGVSGEVQNEKGEPLREAYVRVLEHTPVYNVTKNAAQFQLILPKGIYGLEVGAPNFESRIEKVTIEHGKITNVGIMKLHPYTLITGEVNEINAGRQTQHGYTTISGHVLDTNNHPIKSAKVSIIAPHSKHYLRNFTDSMGSYSIARVPVGRVTVKVEAPRHFEATRELHLDNDETSAANIVFHLKVNEHVLGMPRMFFILLASVLIIFGIIGFVLCVQFVISRRHRGDKPYYNFSLLPQKGKELFEDDDAGDDGETELFRSPIKKGMTIQPYFDEENLDQVLDSEYDDDELEQHGGINVEDDEEEDEESGDEIVMLDKNKHRRKP